MVAAPAHARRLSLAPLHDGDQDEATRHRIASPGFRALRDRMLAVDGCTTPVRLEGRYAITRTDGQVLHERTGTVEVPCNNRRESVCPACAQRYAADAFHLTRAGLAGGKGVPDTVDTHPMVFTTLTAPSFGSVHTRTTTRRGRIARCRCGTIHHQDDPRIGTATDPAEYDYVGAVLWQAHATRLWNRFTTVLRRTLATEANIRVRELGSHARVSFAKVAEYQRRGLIHFHAVIRLDSPSGPDAPPPAWADLQALTHAIRSAATTTITVDVPDMTGATTPITLRWGSQLDIRPITPPADELPTLAVSPHDDREDESEDSVGGAAISSRALAGYIAKYATKSTAASDTAERRLRCGSDIALVPTTAHHRRLMWTCWALGARSGLEGLRRWAHMLGFGGHFLTKSRTYSTTFTALRGARRHHARTALLEDLGITDDRDDVVVINDWRYIGHGWAQPEDREIAVAIHQRRRDHNRRTQNRTERQAA